MRVLKKDEKEYKSASKFVINRPKQRVSHSNNPKLSEFGFCGSPFGQYRQITLS